MSADRDSAAQTMDAGASAALKHTDVADGIYEDTKRDLSGQTADVKTQGVAGSMFDASGAIGKQFTTGGVIGGTAQKLGGPFDAAQGSIGKAFTTQGSIGGAVQNTLGSSEKRTVQDK